jgi:hypothetical protein
MGFNYRKSVNLGPFRVNLSKSGLGYSVGGRGFRVGTTARGKKYCLARALRVSPFGLLFEQATERLPSRLVHPSASQEQDSATANPARAASHLLQAIIQNPKSKIPLLVTRLPTTRHYRHRSLACPCLNPLRMRPTL